MQELGQEEGSDVVGAELLLVALDRLAALRRGHDAGVVPEDVQSVIVGEEGVGCGLDGGQVVQVEMQVDELALGVGDSGFDALDRFGRFGLGAGEHVDFGIFLVEDVGQLLPNAGGRACHDKDLIWSARDFVAILALAHFARLVGHVLLRELGGRGEHLGVLSAHLGSGSEQEYRMEWDDRIGIACLYFAAPL